LRSACRHTVTVWASTPAEPSRITIPPSNTLHTRMNSIIENRGFESHEGERFYKVYVQGNVARNLLRIVPVHIW
jgi:hypothetical protein